MFRPSSRSFLSWLFLRYRNMRLFPTLIIIVVVVFTWGITGISLSTLLSSILNQLVTLDVALCILTTSKCFHFYTSTKNGNCIKTTCWQTNSYRLGQVGEDDLYKEDWFEKPPTLVQEILVAVDGGITMEKIQWSEHDPSIMESWKSLRSGLRMFLHAVSNAIDILVEHFSSIYLAKVTNKRDDAFRMGWREPDCLSTSVRNLKTRRMIINPERFLYSRANMNPNTIEIENRFHAEMEGGYSLSLWLWRKD